jgi:hypothetical protein
MAPLNGREGAATHVIPSPAPSRILFSALPIRSHIRAAMAASLTGKSRLKIG